MVCGVLCFHAPVVALDPPDAKHAPLLAHLPTARLAQALRFHAPGMVLVPPDAKHTPLLAHSPTALMGHVEGDSAGSNMLVLACVHVYVRMSLRVAFSWCDALTLVLVCLKHATPQTTCADIYIYIYIYIYHK